MFYIVFPAVFLGLLGLAAVIGRRFYMEMLLSRHKLDGPVQLLAVAIS